MRRAVVLAVLLLGAIPASAGASAREIKIASSKRLSARLTDFTLTTAAFDFHPHVRVLLPSRYAAHPRRRYPVLYLLHGSVDDAASWTAKGNAERLTAGLPLIVVMPSTTGKGNAGGWGSDWWNEGQGGPPRWETFTIDQLIPWVDTRYRTIRRRGGRAIAGLSMGGFNTMSHAARHPDLFAAASSYSGAVDTNYPGVQPVIQAETLGDGGRTPDSIWGPRSIYEINWRAHNPWDLAENLTGMALAIRTGNGQPGPYDNRSIGTDPIEYGVHEMSVSLHQRFNALHMRHVFDDYGPGTHSWPYWQRDLKRDLPRFMAVFRDPPDRPSPFTYRSAEPAFSVYGWQVKIRRQVAEFAELARASARGFTLRGSGSALVTTPRCYPARSVHALFVKGRRHVLRADRSGRVHVTVTLGPSNTGQEFRPGSETKVYSALVRIVGRRLSRCPT